MTLLYQDVTEQIIGAAYEASVVPRDGALCRFLVICRSSRLLWHSYY